MKLKMELIITKLLSTKFVCDCHFYLRRISYIYEEAKDFKTNTIEDIVSMLNWSNYKEAFSFTEISSCVPSHFANGCWEQILYLDQQCPRGNEVKGVIRKKTRKPIHFTALTNAFTDAMLHFSSTTSFFFRCKCFKILGSAAAQGIRFQSQTVGRFYSAFAGLFIHRQLSTGLDNFFWNWKWSLWTRKIKQRILYFLKLCISFTYYFRTPLTHRVSR